MPLGTPQFQVGVGAGMGSIPSELGYGAWTSDPGLCVPGTTQGHVAGVLQLRRLSIPGPMQLAEVVLNITTAGTVLTAAQCFAGAWDGAGNLIGLSLDQSGNFAATGVMEIPLASGAGLPGPPFNADTPYIYVGYWWNGTTGPQLLRESILNGAINGLSTFPAQASRSVTGPTGLTTVATVPQNLGVLTKSTLQNFWAAVV